MKKIAGSCASHLQTLVSWYILVYLYITYYTFMHLVSDPSETIVKPVSGAKVLPDITNLQREAPGMKQ